MLKDKLNGDVTLVISKNGEIITSRYHGVRPVLQFLSEGDLLEDADVADRVIGKASAMLLIKGKVKSVYGQVMSEAAIQTLEAYGIPYSYGEKVPYIVNNDGTDMCPMEKTVRDIDSLEEAEIALRNKVKELMSGSK